MSTASLMKMVSARIVPFTSISTVNNVKIDFHVNNVHLATSLMIECVSHARTGLASIVRNVIPVGAHNV